MVDHHQKLHRHQCLHHDHLWPLPDRRVVGQHTRHQCLSVFRCGLRRLFQRRSYDRHLKLQGWLRHQHHQRFRPFGFKRRKWNGSAHGHLQWRLGYHCRQQDLQHHRRNREADKRLVHLQCLQVCGQGHLLRHQPFYGRELAGHPGRPDGGRQRHFQDGQGLRNSGQPHR